MTYGLRRTFAAVAVLAFADPAYAQLTEKERLEFDQLQARSAALVELAAMRAKVAGQEKALGLTPTVANAIVGPAVAAQPPATVEQTTAIAAAAATAAATTAANSAAEKVGNRLSQQNLGESAKSTQKLGGIDFGIGFAFTNDLGNNDRIKEAVLDTNNIVRVTEQENIRARIVLESHYFFTPKADLIFGLTNKGDENQWGFGPFVALQPGTDNVIDAIGAGLMVGLKRKRVDTTPPTATSNDSFNIGIGVMYDLNAQLLGEGIERNEVLPAGDTKIRYLKTSQSGFMIMTSYSF